MFEEKKLDDQEKTIVIPLLPLRDVVVFPHMIVPLFVGREKSIAALESAMKYEKGIFMVAQKNAKKDDPRSGRYLQYRYNWYYHSTFAFA